MKTLPSLKSPFRNQKKEMKGFIARDYADRFEEGISQLAQWVREGRLKYKENVVEGFENTIKAFLGLFAGENLGKQLVEVAD